MTQSVSTELFEMLQEIVDIAVIRSIAFEFMCEQICESLRGITQNDLRQSYCGLLSLPGISVRSFYCFTRSYGYAAQRSEQKLIKTERQNFPYFLILVILS